MSTLVCKYEEGHLHHATIVHDDIKTAADKLKAYLDHVCDDSVELVGDGDTVNVILRSDDQDYDGTTVYAVMPFTEITVARIFTLLGDHSVEQMGLTPVG